MAETKFTEGPWRGCHNGTCPCGYIFGDEGEVYVAQAIGPGNVQNGMPDPYPTEEAQTANAHLIAAAPELYEALSAARQQLITLGGEVVEEGGKIVSDPIQAAVLAVIDAALARARGEEKADG